MPESPGGTRLRGQDAGPVSVVTLVALLGEPGGIGQATQEGKSEIVTVPRGLLASLIGSAESAALMERARQDLKQHIGLLLDEESLRFAEVLEEAGSIDEVAAVRLYQAEYSLEAAR
jgi:hypothetical protein